MPEPLQQGLSRIRSLVLDDVSLVRALGTGRRRGESPRWRRVEMRYVDLRSGRHLQVTSYDDTQAHTKNHARGSDTSRAVDDLLAEPFGNWHVDTADQTIQLRVTKKLQAQVVTSPRSAEAGVDVDRSHDRAKLRMLAEDDPVLVASGISDANGRVKPSRQGKYRQVEEFLRMLGPALDDALASGSLRPPTDQDPLQVVDLGCGNAYLTFAAHRYLTEARALPVRLVGVDLKQQALRRNTALAHQLGLDASVTFLHGDITSAPVADKPGLVLALHACDTATDDAIARAVEWDAPLVLAAPCCHHDVASQLRRAPAPAPYSMLTRDGILRERFADTLTDALRAAVLRLLGYRVDVVEFVESRHTPRNTLLRAVRTNAEPSEQARRDLDALTREWQVRPRLAELLDARLP